HIPVEDNDGKFIGMISRESIFNELMGSKAGFDDKTVGDLMVKNIPGLDPDDPIEKAGEIMVNQKLSGLPVVVRGSITGMVTLSDMLSFSMDYLKQRKKTES
ncbi:MAG TPA: CBS domain-containing protein, partial [Cryomorphaceae bacterium]|nr:CBS domain-containing protein [Cryomorphaceae bacterium]